MKPLIDYEGIARDVLDQYERADEPPSLIEDLAFRFRVSQVSPYTAWHAGELLKRYRRNPMFRWGIETREEVLTLFAAGAGWLADKPLDLEEYDLPFMTGKTLAAYILNDENGQLWALRQELEMQRGFSAFDLRGWIELSTTKHGLPVGFNLTWQTLSDIYEAAWALKFRGRNTR